MPKEYIEREAKCGDCIHADVCEAVETLVNFSRDNKAYCGLFCNAADVVEIVRCLNCKHYYYYGKTTLFVDNKHLKAGWCQRRIRNNEEHRMLPDDFCSYGERKTE